MRTLFYPFNYENREVLIYRDYLKKEYKDCIYVIENENSKNNFAELSKKYKVSAECSTDISTIIKDVEQVIILPIENMGISHYKNIIKILESKKTIKNFNKKLDGLLTDEIDKGNVCVENIYKKSNLPKEITDVIDGSRLFVEISKISRMFRFSMRNKQLIIILDTVKLDKHFIFYLNDLLDIIKKNI